MRPLSVSKPGSQRGYFSEWEPDSSRPLGGARSRAASRAGLAAPAGALAAAMRHPGSKSKCGTVQLTSCVRTAVYKDIRRALRGLR